MSADGFRVLGSLWTLTIEMIFYLALPVMVIPFCESAGWWPRRWPSSRRWPTCGRRGLVGLHRRRITVESMSRYQLTGPALRASWLSNQFPAFLGDFGLGITAANLCVLARSPRQAAGDPEAARTGASLVLSVGGFVLIFTLYLNGSQHWARVAYYGDHLILRWAPPW